MADFSPRPEACAITPPRAPSPEMFYPHNSSSPIPAVGLSTPSSSALEKGACCPGLSSRQPNIPSFGLDIVLLSAPHSSWDFVLVDVVFPFKRKHFLVLPAREPEVCMWLCRAVGVAVMSVLPPIPSPEPSSHPARAAGPS